MRSVLVFVTSILLFMPFISADIKDFIIENENDLKRFGSEDTEQHYDDDLDSEWMPDSCGGGGGGPEVATYPYSDLMDTDVRGMEYDTSQIDPRLLREIMRQMKNDPRFEHLWEQLTEGNILLDHKMSPDEFGANDDTSNFYIDMNTNFQGGDNYEIE